VCCAALLLDVRGLWWELRVCKLLYIQEGEWDVPLDATVVRRESLLSVSVVCQACAEMVLLRDCDGEPRLRCWRLATSHLSCFGKRIRASFS
jgi:hypothetical protein